jgi:hypothetical protein
MGFANKGMGWIVWVVLPTIIVGLATTLPHHLRKA